MEETIFLKNFLFSFLSSFIAEQAGRTKLGIQRRWIEIRSQRRLGYLRSRDTTNRNRWKVRKDLISSVVCILFTPPLSSNRTNFFFDLDNEIPLHIFFGNQHTQTLSNFSPLFLLFTLRVGQSKQEPCLLFIYFSTDKIQRRLLTHTHAELLSCSLLF
jgi:hypothetical protein